MSPGLAARAASLGKEKAIPGPTVKAVAVPAAVIGVGRAALSAAVAAREAYPQAKSGRSSATARAGRAGPVMVKVYLSSVR